jgi:hypothetical protein
VRGYLPAKETGRMSMAEKKDNVTSKFKDNVFCMLYRDKKNLLELYNALNNSAYTNVDDLQVTTLNGGSYMKYKNDASFLLCMSLYMFEQQSSKNPNMPLRFLHYVSDVFRELFSNSMLHRRSMIKIPVPHFVTFYNGLEKWVEDEDEIRLSDMYEIPTDNPELELKVRVININEDVHILNKCKTLRDYMTFVNKVRFKMGVEGDNVRIAVTEAMNECIDEDILVDFFEQHREEVVEVSIYDYDEEEVRRVLAEEYAQEVAQGMAQEIVEKAAKEASEKAFAEGEQSMMINQIIKKVKKSKTLETIASELEEEVADIKPIYDVVIAAAPDYNIDIIKNKLAIN